MKQNVKNTFFYSLRVFHCRLDYYKNKKKRSKTRKQYYERAKMQIRKKRIARYSLKEPKPVVKEMYAQQLMLRLMSHAQAKSKLMEAYCKVFEGREVPKVTTSAVCRIASLRLVSLAMKLRKSCVSLFLKHCHKARDVSIEDTNDFGKRCHTLHSEPFFYETSYMFVKKDFALPVDEYGQCVIAKEVKKGESTDKPKEDSEGEPDDYDGEPDDNDGKPKDGPEGKNSAAKTKKTHKKVGHRFSCWECSIECKPLTDAERSAIFELRHAFDLTTDELRRVIDTCDSGCPNTHYTKPIDDGCTSVPRLGHPFLCHTGKGCTSTIRILRAASVHYEKLRKLRKAVDAVRLNNGIISAIDRALYNGNYKPLLDTLGIGFEPESLVSLFSTDDDSNSAYSCPISEVQVMVENALVIDNLRKEIEDDPDKACCCCNLLHQSKNVIRVHLSDDLDSLVWDELKAFLDPDSHSQQEEDRLTAGAQQEEEDPDYQQEEDSSIADAQRKENRPIVDTQLYLCSYCRKKMKIGEKPARCVLNGLQIVAIPPELAKLDSLSTQFIQLAKSFQTIVRLGTYMGKVPSYNSLKACKGTMFFLPLPHNTTIETLNDVSKTNPPSSLPSSPELYIMVNGQPTKTNVVWRSLVDVNAIKRAKKKLQQINWLYRVLDDNEIDESVKKVVEIAYTATEPMLEKATSSEVADMQSYTIRNFNRLAPKGTDIEQYKMLSVKQNPIDNRLKYLDVMCFPVLFPNGEFGRYHEREVSLSHAEYTKCRLWNRDSRFRKDSQYVFFLLHQKEMREVAAGVYNLLKKTKSRPMAVDQLLSKVQSSDQYLESNLTTMLQQVRGTQQYWFTRQSEVKCMIREYGPPTLFLTFSCAEYECADIARYLRKINDVPDNYPIGRLCTEDPISVSRKFSQKFHAFWQKVLIKGEVLGKVNHFYWKKEYQNRGAPHYHAIVWIDGAPVAGKDKPEAVKSFIEKRITCRIPDKDESPELHRLVTRYQLHKCSAYCRRRRKVGPGTFITTCKFGFPRPESETIELLDATVALKSRKKIYNLPRSENEIRVNDYNPLMLLLWKANCDIQFVAESSLALAHYVTGYVTKAEKSNMQGIFEEMREDQKLYSKLFKFGIRCLRNRECGLCEASDILLGDHLCEKSVTVKWVDVSLPHKRSHRLKKHADLQNIHKKDPESEDIFEDSLLETHYPKRPINLENVCLYDFVANYDWYAKDKQGNRCCRKLTKPRLPNHRLFDSSNVNQQEDYFYSMILLFHPFRDESSLLLTDETAEEAFHRLMKDNKQCAAYHERMQVAVKARTKVKEINQAREELGKQEPLEDDGPLVKGEATTAMKDVMEMCMKIDDSLSYEERVSMLNADQRRVFDSVSDHLNHLKKHEADRCSFDQEPLVKYVAGVAGTGKSFLIEAIKMLVAHLWPTSDLTCAVVAPTGLAAFNVGGLTIHRLFQLPVEHDAKTASYWTLSKDARKVMKTTLRSVKLFIVDEVSMVSSLNLVYVHMRLDELFGCDSWFGGKSVLFFGDLLQLEPVNGNPIFESVSRKSIMYKLGSLTSVNIWKDCVKYDELTINERQKKDPQFSSMLNDIRVGNVTDESVRILEEKVVDVPMFERYQELKDSGTLPVCMFATRKACAEFNDKALDSLSTEKHELLCVDDIDESSSKRKWTSAATKQLEKLNHDCNLTGGLQAKLVLAVGCRVMLRRNIDTSSGLVNGAIGTVCNITQSRVTVQFDHMSSPYDVEVVSSKFMIMKSFYVYRRQFPLIPAAAITIHKSQGLSLDSCMVDLSVMVFGAGMAYVALSRVRTLSGLHLANFSPKSVIVSRKCLSEFNRLRQLFRSDLPLYVVPPESSSTRRKPVLCGNLADNLPQEQTSRTTRKQSARPKVKKQSPASVTPSATATVAKRPRGRPRKDSVSSVETVPCAKKMRTAVKTRPSRQPISTKTAVVARQQPKKRCGSPAHGDEQSKKQCVVATPEPPCVASSNSDDDLVLLQTVTQHRQYFCPVDVSWQRTACAVLDVHYHNSNNMKVSGLDGEMHQPLTEPNLRRVKRIGGDGNCLFRSFSYIVTGSEEHHMEIRQSILLHMIEISGLLMGHHINSVNTEQDNGKRSTTSTNVGRYRDIYHYIRDTKMDRNGSWGTDVEILTFAHLLQTPIFTYSVTHKSWWEYGPRSLERHQRPQVVDTAVQMGMYLRHSTNHYEVVCGVMLQTTSS